MPQPAAADRFRDDRALVADDRIVQSRVERVWAYRLEHPAGDEDDVNPCRVRGRDRRERPWMQESVFADQRAVEVAGDGLHVTREILRELQPCGLLRKSTRSFSCPAGSVLYVFGITFLA